MAGDTGVVRAVQTSLAADRTPEYDAPPEVLPSRSAWTMQQAQCIAFVGADLFAFVMATLLAYLALSDQHTPLWDWTVSELLAGKPPGHIVCLVLIMAMLIGYFARRGHYTERVPFLIEMREACGAIAIALLCDAVLLKTAIYHVDYTLDLALRWIVFAPLLLMSRSIGRRMLNRLGLWRWNTLIIGPSSAVARIAAALSSEPTLGYRVVGGMDPADLRMSALVAPEADCSDASHGWTQLLRSHAANFLAIASGCGDPAAEARMIFVAQRARVPFVLVPAARPVPALSKRPHYFLSHDVTVLPFHTGLSRPVARHLKHAFDLLAASLLLVLCSPLMLAIAVLVRQDGAPALYQHRRIGAGGKSFDCMKFRTMHVDADTLLADILARDPVAAAEWATTQKLHDDPRITPIGQVLRKTSLDELPQLYNVLRGEMSLVGPRPIVAAEVAFYGGHIAEYYETRPGITGLWQVSGRSDTSYPRRVQLDVWYVRNWTLWHDIAILLKTLPAVLQKRGAV